MRVISGSAKGIQLKAVPGSGTRPITDRVKEALFNILGAQIVGARVLDLFAGTGGVGIEALSRGAEHAVFVEKHGKAVATIRTNLDRTRLKRSTTLVKADVFKYLSGKPQSFDLVYIAPPQYQGLWSRTLLSLDANVNWLQPDGLAIAQIFPKELQSLALTNLELTEQRRYGSTLLCFFELVASRE